MNWVNKIKYKNIDELIYKQKQMLKTKNSYDNKCITKNGVVDIEYITNILLETKNPESVFYNMTIHVVGDYDVDGICSTGCLKRLAQELNLKMTFRLPKRFSEGYGLSEKIVSEIESGILLTVDNGIAAHEAINKAKEKGLFVIVTDHHLPMLNEDGSDNLPNADIIFNPHLSNTCAFKDYCGAGIAYKLAEKISDNKKLLTELSVYAAFASIADCVPLVEDNRNIVINGLKNVFEPDCLTSGMTALLAMSEIYFRPLINIKKSSSGTITERKAPEKNKGVIIKTKDNHYLLGFYASFEKFLNENKKVIPDSEIESWAYIPKGLSPNFYLDESTISYKIAPMLNAPGRLIDDGANLSLELITFNGDMKEAVRKAVEIYVLNEKRKELVADGLEKINSLIEAKHMQNNYPLAVYYKDLHEGIVGILAGQLVEKYHAPVIVCTNSGSALKGSARSTEDVNIKELLDKHANLLLKYGGHPEAAGLSLRESDFDEFSDAIMKSVTRTSKENSLDFVAEIEAEELSTVAMKLQELKPHGEGNPKPIVLIKNFKLIPDIYNNTKYRLCQEGRSVILNGNGMSAIGFDLAGQYLTLTKNPLSNADNLFIVGTIDENHFNGKVTPQIEMMDFKGTNK